MSRSVEELLSIISPRKGSSWGMGVYVGHVSHSEGWTSGPPSPTQSKKQMFLQSEWTDGVHMHAMGVASTFVRNEVKVAVGTPQTGLSTRQHYTSVRVTRHQG